MKKQHLLIALLFLILPITLRALWFYHGIYLGNPNVQAPEYESLSIPQPTLSTIAAPDLVTSTKKVTVLFDQAHLNKFTFAEIEPFRNNLLAQGAEILALEDESDLPDLLKKSEAFVIITPTNYYSATEIEALEEFVLRGGRLLVIADPTRSYSEYDTEREDSVILANEILQPFRLSFRNDYVYNLTHNEGNFRNVYVYPADFSNIAEGINELVFYSTHSLESNSDKILIGEENTLSSLDDKGGELPVAVLDTSGNVLALGDMTFMTNPYFQVSDNYRLIQNISKFLMEGERKKNLFDFPYVFNQAITVQLSEGISLDQGLLLSITDLKEFYAWDDLSVTIDYQPEVVLDRIVLGIYPPGDELKLDTDSFGINFFGSTSISTPTPTLTGTPFSERTSEESSTITEKRKYGSSSLSDYFNVPGIGLIPSEGFGFILLKQEEDHIVLILLADSQENATALLNLLTTGSLEGCLTTNTIAVCEQESVYSPDSAPDTDELLEEIESAIPTEESTMIPEPGETPLPTETPTPG